MRYFSYQCPAFVSASFGCATSAHPETIGFRGPHEGSANKVHTITMLMRKQGTVNWLYMQRMCQKGSLGTSDLKADMNTLVTLKVRIQRLLRDIPNLEITQRIVIKLKPTIVIGEDQLTTRTQ